MRKIVVGLVAASSLLFVDVAIAGDDPWADEIVSYDPGVGALPGYDSPSVVLGPPERFSGEDFDPGVVSVFQAAWKADELVSIGTGGHITVRFDSPIEDDPDNLFGIDFIVFGNAFFSDSSSGTGVCGSPCALFSESGIIEVSDNGVTWHEISGVDADGLFPTNGYLDVDDPFSATPGVEPTDFTRPVDPRLTIDDFAGQNYDEIKEMYRGSGGGAGVDIASTGLSSVSFVRVSGPTDGFDTPEIDAFADVPPRLPGDVNLDGAVDTFDLLDMLSAWGKSAPGDLPADFNYDGFVDTFDLLTLLENWSG